MKLIFGKKKGKEVVEKNIQAQEQVSYIEEEKQMETNYGNEEPVVDLLGDNVESPLSERDLEHLSVVETAKDSVESGMPICEEPAQTTVSLSPEDRVKKINDIKNMISQGLYGKDEAVRLALLSAIAGESIFFLGPPGTAKSMISRRIAWAFDDIDQEKEYFEYLMNEFSTPDEICGPVSLAKLNQDEYVRKTEGYLPSAKVAFLDEIWKSGPAILNTLLTIINEKKFHNGKKVEKVPLVSLAAASNELPERNRGLEALWDRFILRVMVNPVNDNGDFFNLIEGTDNFGEETDEKEVACLLTVNMVKSWQQEILQVELPEEVKEVILAIREELVLRNNNLKDEEKEFESWYVSDRRWKKIVHLLKTSAFLNGRNAVDLMDCSLIAYCIWNTDSQQREVGSMMENILSQYRIDCSSTFLKYDLDKFEKKVDETWFDLIVEPAIPAEPDTDKIVSINRDQYYECFDENNDTCYVSAGVVDSYYNRHRVLDSNYHHCRDAEFSRKGDKITCYWEFTVRKNPGKPAVPEKKYLQKKIFEPVAKLVRLQEFTEKYYEPLREKIREEISSLQEYREEHEAPFKANIFAQLKFSSILLGKIDKEIKKMEDLQMQLEKQKDRYAYSLNVKTNFELGEIILTDGTVRPKDYQVKNGEKILGKVCLVDNGVAYAIDWYDHVAQDFEEVQRYAKEFGVEKKLFSPYDSGWRLPTINELQKIYQNIKEKKWKQTVTGKIWSATKHEDDGVYYFDFDSGEQDHTTPDHQYGVFFIRKLAVEE